MQPATNGPRRKTTKKVMQDRPTTIRASIEMDKKVWGRLRVIAALGGSSASVVASQLLTKAVDGMLEEAGIDMSKLESAIV